MREFVDAPLMASAEEIGGQERLDAGAGHVRSDQARAHRDNVRVVMLARQPGRKRLRHQCAAAGQAAVDGDGDADTGSAQRDAALCVAGFDRTCQAMAEIRIIDRRIGGSAKVDHVMTQFAQPGCKIGLERDGGMIGGDGDAGHGASCWGIDAASLGASRPICHCRENMTHTIAPELRTDRLRMRAHGRDDADRLLAMWQEPDVVRHFGGQPVAPEDSWNRLLRYVGHWVVNGYGLWAVEVAETGAYIGDIGLFEGRRGLGERFDSAPEAGWVLHPNGHGQGYAREAVAAALRWGEAEHRWSRTVA
eukprot:TRINITY_DN6652_c0_g1_i1.p1 TRINITY_DN6652_c0_g1~~TRINITY_DN6652_c0_g1_i1.p1  ORF type:complete len:306 (-),score=-61.85 TRINITY_DN6652_c0_g1_i1:698-1615(-)